MLAWIIGAIVPAGALCIAALLAEQAMLQRRLPGRWIWIAAMSLSILLPTMGRWLPAATPLRLPIVLTGPGPTLALHPLDALGPPLWLALSAATLLALALGAGLVQRRSRAWRRMRIGDLEVYLAREAGPAVFGLWQPRIVLPEWLNHAPPRQRELAIAHERSHLVARDPQLLACALMLVSIMPWNLPLWWQLWRLRRAIEIDCDGRVLRAGGDLLDYGETLIQLSQHQSRMGGLMAATSAPQSFLERRIQIMSAEMSRFSRLAAAAWMCLALGTAVVAADLTPPPGSVDRPAAQPHAPNAPNATAAQAAKAEAEIAEARAHEAKQDAENSEEVEAGDDVEDAEMAANDAMHDADEQIAEANEAMHEAEQQKAEAMIAKHEAETAAAEARARKRETEAAAH